MLLKKILYTVFIIGLASLSACSSSSNEQTPVGSTIVITPDLVEFDIGPSAGCVEGVFQDIPYVITVQDSNGTPLGDVELTVIVDFTDNTSGGLFNVLRLYEDRNSNGVVDDPEEFVTDIDSPAFVSQTGTFTGTKNLLLRVNLSCPYRGNMRAFAGAATGVANIGVEVP